MASYDDQKSKNYLKEAKNMLELTKRNNNRLNYYDPFREIEEFERRFFGGFFSPTISGSDVSGFRTDITDKGDHFLMEADLPGFEKSDIHLELDKDILKISAERHSKAEEKDDSNRVIRMERSYGSYARSFNVSSVDTDRIKAKYENGVLILTLPKKQETIPEKKQLEIE